MPTLCGAERDLAERDEHVAHGVLRDVLRGRGRAAHHVLVLGPREDELRRRLLRANHAAPCRATTDHAQFQGRARDARETQPPTLALRLADLDQAVLLHAAQDQLSVLLWRA